LKKLLLLACFAATPFLLKAQCSAQVSLTNVTCYNACNGTATATPSGGTPPYTYLWGPQGQTTQTVTGLCSGPYNVNVIDAVGCSTIEYFNITQPGQIALTYSQVPATCTTCCDGSATAIPSGGVAPYTYSWFPSGNTNVTETGLCPGTYSFTVTDSNGCTVGMLCNVGNSVGIEDQVVLGNLSIFPNPASQIVNIQQTFSKPVAAEITLTNMLGQAVHSESRTAVSKLDISLNISHLPDGVYFLSVRTSAGTTVKRIVKQ
jgi:hypothetical protein